RVGPFGIPAPIDGAAIVRAVIVEPVRQAETLIRGNVEVGSPVVQLGGAVGVRAHGDLWHHDSEIENRVYQLELGLREGQIGRKPQSAKVFVASDGVLL